MLIKPTRKHLNTLDLMTQMSRLDLVGTPVMACDSWGASPLYENEDLKEGRIPTVTPIEQVRDEDNCGEATHRGEDPHVR